MKLSLHVLAAATAVVAVTAVVAATGWAEAPAKGKRPPAATPPPAAAAPPAAPAAPAAPGNVVITADADDLVAEIKPASGDARVVGLVKGDNRIELAAGDATVTITTKAGRRISDNKVTVASGADVALDVKSRGKLVVQAPADASVELDGKDVPADAGQFSVDTTSGGHSVLVQRPGYYGQKGNVDVEVGKTAKLAPEFESFDAGSRKTIAWAGIIGGGALVVTAIVIDANTTYNQAGGDVVRWTLLGAGGAAFVGGTVLLKAIMDEAAPVKDAKFSVQLAHLPGGGSAALALRF